MFTLFPYATLFRSRGVEALAQTMIMALAKIGALEVLDHG